MPRTAKSRSMSQTRSFCLGDDASWSSQDDFSGSSASSSAYSPRIRIAAAKWDGKRPLSDPDVLLDASRAVIDTPSRSADGANDEAKECYMCGETMKMKRKRDWQYVELSP